MQVRSGPPDRQPRGGGGGTQPEAPLDLLVIGSGVAGLSAAVRAADRGLVVGVLTKGHLEQSTTRWAQGGIAAVLGGDPDSELGQALAEARDALTETLDAELYSPARFA